MPWRFNKTGSKSGIQAEFDDLTAEDNAAETAQLEAVRSYVAAIITAVTTSGLTLNASGSVPASGLASLNITATPLEVFC